MARNQNLLNNFAADFQKAATFHNDDFTDQANYDTRTRMLSEARGTYMPKIRDLAEHASTPVDTARLAKAVGVDFNNTAAVNALAVKWPQVVQLIESGKHWDEVIADADMPMLAAIVEHAPSYLETQSGGDVVGQIYDAVHYGKGKTTVPIAEQLDAINTGVARRAVKLGNNGAKSWLDDRAGRAYDAVLAEKMLKHAQGNGSSNVAGMADMWVREAETRAAQVKGELSPNERDAANQQAQRSAEFTQQAQDRQHAPGESPAELAAKIGRQYS